MLAQNLISVNVVCWTGRRIVCGESCAQLYNAVRDAEIVTRFAVCTKLMRLEARSAASTQGSL